MKGRKKGRWAVSIDALVIIILAGFFLYHINTLFGYKIVHEFPYGMMASDTFQHQTRAESIKVMGNYKNEAPWIVAGYTDNPGFYQPLLYHIGVLLSYVSGLETWDTTYYAMYLMIFLGMLSMYFMIRYFNKHVALASVPFMILVFMKPNQIAMTWGHWASIAAQGFLLGAVFMLYNIKKDYSWVFIGLLVSAVYLTHSSEAVFTVIFIILMTAYNIIRKKWALEELKKLFYAAILTLILCFYYLIIFLNSWAKMQPYRFFSLPIYNNLISSYLSDYGVVLILLIGGMIASLSMIAGKNRSRDNFILAAAWIFLLIGYTNYAGFSVRAFQFRFLWPVYLSSFFGLAVYMVVNIALKKTRAWHMLLFSAVFLLLFSGVVKSIDRANIPHTIKFTGPGLMDPYHWQMFKFLQEKTPPDSTVYFAYGDIYGQNAVLRNSERVHYQIQQEDYIASMQNRTLRTDYKSILRGDSHGVNYTYRKSFFSFGMRRSELGSDYYYQNYDICSMDYVVFDMQSRTPALAQYNALLANEMINKGTHELAFSNEIVVILKNNRPGEDCIGKREF